MINRLCLKSDCKKQFDQDKQTIHCPHNFISKLVICIKHNRFNCGNSECSNVILSMNQTRKEKQN